MKKKAIVIFLIIFLTTTPLSYARVVDKIAAVVNDEVITQSEIDRIIYPIYMQYKNVYKSEEELYKELDKTRAAILRQLIDDRLILCEARKTGITVAEKEIDEMMASAEKDLAEKGMNLGTMLKEQNLTQSDLRGKYRDQLMVQKAVDRIVKGRVDIQPSEVSVYYHAHIDEYTQPEQVGVRSIFIRLQSVRTPLESRKLADDIHRMLLEGRDFVELARNYSEDAHKEDGGDFGYVSRDQFLKEIDDAIFSLKPGEISEVVESPIGYHIFNVYDRKDQKVLPFEKVSLKVTEALYRTKAQEKFEEWLEKLRSNAYISIK